MNIKPFEWVHDICRAAHIKLINKVSEYAECPRRRKIMALSAVTTFSGLCVANLAHADGTGIASMVTTAGTQADTIKQGFGKLFGAAGFGGGGYGGYHMWKKSKEGPQSQITGLQIFGPLIGGAALGGTGYMMVKSGESVGMDASSQGALPQ